MSDLFLADYSTARAAFRAAADRLGWMRTELPLAARGPRNEDLSLDIALSAATGKEPLLFLSGGVHGVEGPVGSAVQLAALQQFAASGPPPGVRCLFLHAVNPHGYAHGRRFDDGNVDLNRNFLDEGEPYAGSPPLYAELDVFLNPRRPPARWDPFTLRALLMIARYGRPALKQAIAGGQYDFPRGLFYGGREPAPVHRLLAKQLHEWLSDAGQVCHLDFHTGLGPWATYKLLLDPPVIPDERDRAIRWFGADAVEASMPEGVAYQTRGSFGPWCARQSRGRNFLTLTAEFGTYENIAVLAAIRAENQAHHWDHPGTSSFQRARARLAEVFCPASPRWRELVLAQSLALVGAAVAGLRGAS